MEHYLYFLHFETQREIQCEGQLPPERCQHEQTDLFSVCSNVRMCGLTGIRIFVKTMALSVCKKNCEVILSNLLFQ